MEHGDFGGLWNQSDNSMNEAFFFWDLIYINARCSPQNTPFPLFIFSYLILVRPNWSYEYIVYSIIYLVCVFDKSSQMSG
jgi:hypothetical protein